MSATHVEVGEHLVRITSPERVLFPRTDFTKADLLRYTAEIAHVLLPHVGGRPLSLRRFPEGVEGNTWYQTRCGPNHPPFVETCVLEVPGGTPQDYCVISDLAGLLWSANLSAIELHPLLMRASDVDTPTMVVFDLDPGEGAGMLDCARVALHVRAALDAAGLRSFVKTSGSIGIHVVAPLNTPATFDDTKAFARVVASAIARAEPDLVVDRQARHLRGGKVLVDWLQNDWRRSTVAPYSVRAGAVPSVSIPLAWDEVEEAVATADERGLWCSPRRALERAAEHGDLFAEVQTLEQVLP